MSHAASASALVASVEATTPGQAGTAPVGCVLEQVIRYEYRVPVRNLHQRLVVVPPAVHGSQRRRSWSIQVAGAGPVSCTERSDRVGNVVLDVLAAEVAEAIEFRVATAVERRGAADVHHVRDDRWWHAATTLTTPDEHLVALAADRPDPATLSARVHAAMRYVPGATTVRTTAAQALAAGEGVCQDYAHLMVTASRSAGTAARYVSGHLLGEGGSHAWVEVLRPDPVWPGWCRVEAWDPTHDRLVDDRYVTVAVGRDYADVAPLSGRYTGRGVVGALTVQKSARRT